MSNLLVKNLLYFLIALPGSLLIYFIFRFSKYYKWFIFDLVAFIFPIQIYLLLSEIIPLKYKGTGNEIGEPLYIGIIYVFLFFIRSILGKIYPELSKKFSLFFLVAVLFLTVGVYFILPDLGE